MNAFRILDANGTALSIKQLDVEAAEFWNKPVHEKYYANPTQPIPITDDMSDDEQICIDIENACRETISWYDSVGWTIANQGNYTSGWPNVAHTLMATSFGEALLHIKHDEPIGLPSFHNTTETEVHLEDKYEINLMGLIQYYQPYVDLMNYWQSKGYVPEQVKE